MTLRNVGAAGGRQRRSPTTSRARWSTRARATPPGPARSATARPSRSAPTTCSSPTGWTSSKVAIPQADEQQRLLANLITQMTLDRTPLPRFWYLPGRPGGRRHDRRRSRQRRHARPVRRASRPTARRAAPSRTGNACARPPTSSRPPSSATPRRGATRRAASRSRCTSTSSGPTPAPRHATTSRPLPSLTSTSRDQRQAFASRWPSLAPSGHRAARTASCGATGPADAEGRARRRGSASTRTTTPGRAPGCSNRPGMFTGSGFPMRFADTDGSLIDVYQAATQLTDESGIDVARHITALLDGALGPEGYYGVFTANVHTDEPDNPGADAIVAEAQARARAGRLRQGRCSLGSTAATARRSVASASAAGACASRSHPPPEPTAWRRMLPAKRRHRRAQHADARRHPRSTRPSARSRATTTRSSPAVAGAYVRRTPARPGGQLRLAADDPSRSLPPAHRARGSGRCRGALAQARVRAGLIRQVEPACGAGCPPAGACTRTSRRSCARRSTASAARRCSCR